MFANYPIPNSSRPVPAPNRCRALILAVSGLALSTLPLAAQSVEAAVDLTALLCNETTAEWGSDEPFIVGTWVNVQTRASGKIHVPAPQRVLLFGQYVTLYSKFGGVDDDTWAITTDRRVFRGWLANGQTVVVALKFWEGDSNYTTDDYARDMAPLVLSAASSLATGGAVSWFTVAEGIFYSAKFLFGWGADDFLGSMTIRLTNVNGQIQKRIEATKLSRLGATTHWVYDYALTIAQRDSLRSLGYEVYMFNNGIYWMRKPVYYGTLSATGKTIRMILDGEGEGQYHASMQVRQGPFTSTQPDGTCLTWTVDNSRAGH